MTDQLALGFDARHTGQDANLAAGTKPYRDDRGRVETAVAAHARTGRPFTADDIHQAVRQVDPTGYNPNLVSSVLGVWAQDGRIAREPAYAVSTRKSRHASRNGVWRGTPLVTEATHA